MEVEKVAEDQNDPAAAEQEQVDNDVREEPVQQPQPEERGATPEAVAPEAQGQPPMAAAAENVEQKQGEKDNQGQD